MFYYHFQDVVESLKRTLASARQQIERMKQQPAGSSKEKVVILTRSDAKGGQHPLPAPQYGEESLKGSRGKGKKSRVETHQGGKRVRYFADDDKYSLSEMVLPHSLFDLIEVIGFDIIDLFVGSFNEKSWTLLKIRMVCSRVWLAASDWRRPTVISI